METTCMHLIVHTLILHAARLLSVTLVAVVTWTVRCLQAVTFLVLRLLLTSMDLCTAWLVLSPVPPPALTTATHGSA